MRNKAASYQSINIVPDNIVMVFLFFKKIKKYIICNKNRAYCKMNCSYQIMNITVKLSSRIEIEMRLIILSVLNCKIESYQQVLAFIC